MELIAYWNINRNIIYGTSMNLWGMIGYKTVLLIFLFHFKIIVMIIALDHEGDL